MRAAGGAKREFSVECCGSERGVAEAVQWSCHFLSASERILCRRFVLRICPRDDVVRCIRVDGSIPAHCVQPCTVAA